MMRVLALILIPVCTLAAYAAPMPSAVIQPAPNIVSGTDSGITANVCYNHRPEQPINRRG
jgi:hypothetical protein